MLLTRILFLVAAVLAAPREESIGRNPTNPYNIPYTVKDENPIHFLETPSSSKQGKEYAVSNTTYTHHDRSESTSHNNFQKQNSNSYDNQRPSLSSNTYDQQTIAQRPINNYGSSNNDQNSIQQRPLGSSNNDQQIIQQRPTDGLSSTNYDQQSSLNKYGFNNNYDQQTNQQGPSLSSNNYDQQTIAQRPINNYGSNNYDQQQTNQQRPSLSSNNYDQQTITQRPINNYGSNNYDQQQTNQQRPSLSSNNYDQQQTNQQRPSLSSTDYDQQRPNTNKNEPSINYNSPNQGGISLANNATPLYVREPSRTRPVLKAEEIGYGDNSEPVVRYDGAQVWNVDINTEIKLRIVGELSRNSDLASWGGDHQAADFMIKPEKLSKVGSVLRTAGIRFNVVIDDLQRYIDDENPQPTDEELDLQDRKARAYRFWNTYRTKGHLAMPVMKPANRRMAILGAHLGYNSLDDHMEYWPFANWGHRMTWKQYHRLADIHGFLDYLANTYPAICTVTSIGRSNQGKDLKMLKISNGNPSNKAVLIDGGIHAREWISPATVTYIINEIVENYDGESSTFRNLDWYIIPVLNPDGYEYTHTIDRLWRKNRSNRHLPCSGIDLNRNFGYKWGGKGTSKNPCSEIYAGTGAFSEPESRALQNFVAGKSNFKLYVTYHSYGEYILYPWGYENAVPEDYNDLDRVAQAAAQAIIKAGGNKYTVGASSIVLYPAAGGSDDWAKAVPKIKYTYTMELSDKGQYGFLLPASQITKVGRESLAALRVLADAAIRA